MSARNAARFGKLFSVALAFSACQLHGQALQGVVANYVVTTGALLSSAVTALNGTTTGGTIYVAPGTVASISGQLQIKVPMTIVCMQNSSISEGSSGTLFVVTASNFLLQNCNVTDTNTGSAAITMNAGSTNFTLLNNTITGEVHMQAASYGLIQGNVVTGIVYGEMNTSYIRAIGNTIIIPSGGGSGLQFHGTTAGETVSHLALIGNHITNAGIYCVEVGAFGNNTVPPVDVVISNNTCDLTGPGTSGGYSLDTVVAPVVSNNAFDAGAQTALVAGIEIVNSYISGASGVPTGPGTGAIVQGNTLNGAGISVNKQSMNLVTGNYINMGVKTTGIFVGGNAEGTNYNQIKDNTIICGSCDSTHRIIWVQNNPGAHTTTAIGNHITGNLLVGASNGEYGIWLEADGTLTSPANFGKTFIEGNTFQNISNDIHPQANTQFTYLYMNTCSATSTWIPSSLPSNVFIVGENGTSCSINQ